MLLSQEVHFRLLRCAPPCPRAAALSSCDALHRECYSRLSFVIGVLQRSHHMPQVAGCAPCLDSLASQEGQAGLVPISVCVQHDATRVTEHLLQG